MKFRVSHKNNIHHDNNKLKAVKREYCIRFHQGEKSMLKAILYGKAGRVEIGQSESVSWLNLYKAREDLLTSTVFERIAYLSEAMRKLIITEWFEFDHRVIGINLGDFLGIDYWPRFAHRHTLGTNTVEPDLILRFSHCNIVVEIKPPNGGVQYFEQWEKEIESFLQNKEENKPLYFLAIGNIGKKQLYEWAPKLLTKFEPLKSVAGIKWDFVAQRLIQHNNSLDIRCQDKAILSDIILGLEIYGIQTNPFLWKDFYKMSMPNLSIDEVRLSSNTLDKKYHSKLENMVFENTNMPILDLTSFATSIQTLEKNI
ncbi:hypothetical protein VIRA109638_16270 [Vibrio rarus]